MIEKIAVALLPIQNLTGVVRPPSGSRADVGGGHLRGGRRGAQSGES